ncbi:hypothetical protein [Halarchaeum grantii]|nr:hypothetical protein [Halarchaeum grantii]
MSDDTPEHGERKPLGTRLRGIADDIDADPVGDVRDIREDV